MFPGTMAQVVLLALVILAASNVALGDNTHIQSSRDGMDYVYFVSDNSLNWFLARKDCISRGLKLASASNAEEAQNLNAALNSCLGDTFWVSGSDLGSAGVWYWDSFGANVQYTNWNAGEPNLQGQEQCLQLRRNDRLWNNDVCSKIFKFVCEGWQTKV